METSRVRLWISSDCEKPRATETFWMERRLRKEGGREREREREMVAVDNETKAKSLIYDRSEGNHDDDSNV